MPSPFPGMDPYVESNPLYHEFHVQFLAEAQRLLQPQVRPKYIAKLERHLSEGSIWEPGPGEVSLAGKQPDVSVADMMPARKETGSIAVLAPPTISTTEELDEDELELRKQRRITIYVQTKPRQAVASLGFLSPSNKDAGSVGQARYNEKRSSALHGGLHWIEIDLLRGGERPALPAELPQPAEYLAYVAQATPTGWNHHVYAWRLRDRLPCLPIPLLGTDQAALDLAACFEAAYDSIGADLELNYLTSPPPPPFAPEDQTWADALLRQNGLRP